MNGSQSRCVNGECQYPVDPQGTEVPAGDRYALCGPQVEPEAGLWLRPGQTICVPSLADVTKLTEDNDPRFGKLDEVFPNTAVEFAAQFEELRELQADRDDPAQLVQDSPGNRPNPQAPRKAFPRSPISRFLDLQPVPFGAVFNTAFCTTRPQFRVEDVVDWRDRIDLDRVIVRTGRELARLFENETPGLYHRHALNWILFNRTDISPPRQARVWMGLDMAIYTALTAAWYYKWRHPRYRFLQRPSEYAREPGRAPFEVLYDENVARSGDGDYGRRLCPDFSPGTPRHPAWPSGHSTYSAAASYILEFFVSPATLDQSDKKVAAAAARITGPERFRSGVWLANELRLLANNIGEARLWGGVHWRGDHEAGQRIGRAAGQAVIDKFLADCVPPVNFGECKDRRNECPDHPDSIQPPPCTPNQEDIRQRSTDQMLHQATPTT